MYLRGDDPAEFYVTRAGRHNVEPYFGWEPLLNALADAREEPPALDHSQVQTLLGAIGDARGMDVCDTAERPLEDGLDAELPRFPFRTAIPPGLDAVLREIDVVWMASRGQRPDQPLRGRALDADLLRAAALQRTRI